MIMDIDQIPEHFDPFVPDVFIRARGLIVVPSYRPARKRLGVFLRCNIGDVIGYADLAIVLGDYDPRQWRNPRSKYHRLSDTGQRMIENVDLLSAVMAASNEIVSITNYQQITIGKTIPYPLYRADRWFDTRLDSITQRVKAFQQSELLAHEIVKTDHYVKMVGKSAEEIDPVYFDLYRRSKHVN